MRFALSLAGYQNIVFSSVEKREFVYIQWDKFGGAHLDGNVIAAVCNPTYARNKAYKTKGESTRNKTYLEVLIEHDVRDFLQRCGVPRVALVDPRDNGLSFLAGFDRRVTYGRKVDGTCIGIAKHEAIANGMASARELDVCSVAVLSIDNYWANQQQANASRPPCTQDGLVFNSCRASFAPLRPTRTSFITREGALEAPILLDVHNNNAWLSKSRPGYFCRTGWQGAEALRYTTTLCGDLNGQNQVLTACSAIALKLCRPNDGKCLPLLIVRVTGVPVLVVHVNSCQSQVLRHRGNVNILEES